VTDHVAFGRVRRASAGVRDATPGRTVGVGPDRVTGRAHQEVTVIGFIIGLFVVGVIAGFLARLLVPGRDPMGFWATVLLGVVGSFVGGFLGWAIFGSDLEDGAVQPSGIIGSVIGAVIALLIYRATVGRSHGDRHAPS
jgi:uncharacterized membrane protein YeaQ/YmgE (transglycosylase-associated protein family)